MRHMRPCTRERERERERARERERDTYVGCYEDESDKYHDYLWRVELRCVRAVALSKILPDVIANYILCFVGTHRS